MIRFIFVCMAVVALSILATAGQFMVDGINKARNGVTARNQILTQPEETAAIKASGPSFEEIYANAPVQQIDASSPEGLNDIETAAGGNDSFSGGFTNVAPRALGDDTAVPAADESQAVAPSSN